MEYIESRKIVKTLLMLVVALFVMGAVITVSAVVQTAHSQTLSVETDKKQLKKQWEPLDPNKQPNVKPFEEIK